MPSPELLPDVEGGVKTYLRTFAPLQTLIGTRVFLAVPGPTNGVPPTFPLVTVQRVGGSLDLSEVPLDLALIQIDVWGRLDASNHPMWAELMGVVNAVRSALTVPIGRTTASADVDVFGVQEAGLVRLVDQANGRPRYSLTVEVSAISS